MRRALFAFGILLCVSVPGVAQAVEVVFRMDDKTYERLKRETFGWLHTGSDQSPVYGKSEDEKLRYAVNYVLPFASFGRIKSLESEGITLEVRE